MDKIREALEYAAEWHSNCYYTQEKAREALALISEIENTDAWELACLLNSEKNQRIIDGIGKESRECGVYDPQYDAEIIKRFIAELERKARDDDAANAHKMIEACKAAVHTWTLRGQSGGIDKLYADMDAIKEATK